MTRHLRRALPLALLLTCLCAANAAAIDIPYLTGRVVDDAGIMSEGTRARVTAALKAHEEATGNQIAVLTVPTIQPDTVEDYAVKVFESWKLGQKDKDNGVLVIVVPQDHKMRIEVGYGLEAALTDGACGQIIRNVMTPAFKANDYDKGIEEGVGAIVAHLESKGEIPSAPESSASSSNGFEAADMPWPQRILMGAFIFGIIGLFTFIGVMTPGVGWFLYAFLIPFWAMFPIVIIGATPTFYLLGTYLIGYPIAKIALGRTDWYKKAARDLKTTGHSSIGGFAFSSGGSGGSSSGGGGFSGGGGSSGGGGASGSW